MWFCLSCLWLLYTIKKECDNCAELVIDQALILFGHDETRIDIGLDFILLHASFCCYCCFVLISFLFSFFGGGWVVVVVLFIVYRCTINKTTDAVFGGTSKICL